MVMIGDLEMDKRIRDLQAQILPLLSDFLATDRVGALEATRMTVQQLVNLVGANVTKQNAYAANGTPDNAFGANGDFFFRIPANGSEIQMYQKISGAWSSVFSLQISYKVDFTNADLDDTTYPGEIVLPFSLPETRTFSGQVRVNYYDTDDVTLLSYELLTPSYDTANNLLLGFTQKVPHTKIYVPII